MCLVIYSRGESIHRDFPTYCQGQISNVNDSEGEEDNSVSVWEDDIKQKEKQIDRAQKLLMAVEEKLRAARDEVCMYVCPMYVYRHARMYTSTDVCVTLIEKKV